MKRLPVSSTRTATPWMAASDTTAPLAVMWQMLFALIAVILLMSAPMALAARMPSPVAEAEPEWGSPQ